MLRPHAVTTAARARTLNRVLVVHDTTHIQPSAKAIRNGFGEDGLRAHVSLAVSADGKRQPLGVLAISTWARPDDKKSKKQLKERRDDEQRESKRWLDQSLAVEELCPETTLIHVEDREADIYESLATRLGKGISFIIRAQSYRKVIVGDGLENILEHLRGQDRVSRRIVTLSRRAKTGLKTAHGERDGRSAKLAFAATDVVIRPPRVAVGDNDQPIKLNAVHVIEEDPPGDDEPVEWLLLTTESVASVEDIDFVVDSYRARWTIEEFFKALKTGCAFEERQLESFDALNSALAIFAVIAWRLLWMRFISRTDEIPAHAVLSDPEQEVLRALGHIGANATAIEALGAIAAIGGHIKRNGEPGWLVIWRGYRTLRNLVSGFLLAQKL